MKRTSSLAIMGALALAILAAAACSDQSGGNLAPPPPPPDHQGLGAFQGSYDDATHTLTISPVATGSVASPRGVNAAIYGNQGTTVNVSVSQFRIDSTSRPGFKIYLFKVNFRNLLTWPIGAIDGSAAPLDTLGIFAFLTIAPTITKPIPCVGCTISLDSANGQGNFYSTNESYYYYRQRLMAKQLVAGLDTTKNSPQWSVTTTSTVKAWNFQFMLNAAWPAPNDTQWNVFYDGTRDSLPALAAEPRWRKDSTSATAGSASFTLGSALTLTAQNKRSIYYHRSDLLPTKTGGYMETRVTLANSASATQPDHVFGIVDGVAQVLLGITRSSVGFVYFDPTNSWSYWTSAGSNAPATTTGTHIYRVSLYAQDSAVIYVDGARTVKLLYIDLPANQVQPGISTFFGLQGQGQTETMDIKYVAYQFGGIVHP